MSKYNYPLYPVIEHVISLDNSIITGLFSQYTYRNVGNHIKCMVLNNVFPTSEYHMYTSLKEGLKVFFSSVEFFHS